MTRANSHGRAGLPSLEPLKSFVATCTHRSITRAAEELHLSQSAVSKQIRALERQIGVPLFRRRHRAIEMTPAGSRLYSLARAWLGEFGDYLIQVRPQPGRQIITITASMGVSALWLLPRLGVFQNDHPDLDVRMAASDQVLDLERDRIDLAIRYCRRSSAPRGAIKLFPEAVVPVAHPSLGLPGAGDGRGLENQVLLEFDDVRYPWLQWAHWFRSIGLDAPGTRGLLRFNQYDQVIQAAIAGQGVAIGRLPLLSSLIHERKLMTLAPTTIAGSDYAYWLIVPPVADVHPAHRLATWLRTHAMDEAAPASSERPSLPRMTAADRPADPIPRHGGRFPE